METMDYEIALISADEIPEEYDENVNGWARAFNAGQYVNILESPVMQSLLCGNAGQLEFQIISEKVEEFLSSASGDQERRNKELQVVSAAAACLLLYVQNNHVGPEVEIPKYMQGEDLQKKALEELSVNGEPAYLLTRGAPLLVVARRLLENSECFAHAQTAEWWLLRSCWQQQMLLDVRSHTLYELIQSLIDTLSERDSIITNDRYRNAQVQLHLEAGYMSYFYYKYEAGNKHFETAHSLSNISVEITGVLGKGTRYQQQDGHYLVAKVTRKNEEAKVETTNSEPIDTNLLPKRAILDDDTYFDDAQFSEDVGELVPADITALEQAVILGLLHDNMKKRAQPEEIRRLEVEAYSRAVLSHPCSWCAMSQALFVRVKFDQNTSRRLQRSIEQIETLVSQFKATSPPGHFRLRHAFCTNIPLVRDVEMEAARMFVSLGSLSTALDIFLRLEMWDDIIRTYAALGRREKAENVIRERLAVEETPALYCYLGDVLNDPAMYHKAWELSNQKFPRAQRNLALYHLRKQEFEASLPFFATATHLSPMEVGIWFSYGCAAMACKEWATASMALNRCVGLESDNYEAWSNLSATLTKMKKLPQAFFAINEAIKCQYDNWRLWENLLVVATEVGEFDSSIKAYHRLLEIKGKHADALVLGALVKAVNEDLPDSNGRPSARLRQKLQELCGRITSMVTSDGDIWRLYAELLHGQSEPTDEVKQRALQYLQKAHRCNTQGTWEKEVDSCKKVTEESVALGKVYMDVAEKQSSGTHKVQLYSSARLMLKAVLAKIQKQHTDPVTDEIPEAVQTMCSSLQELLTELEAKLAEAKGAS